MSQHHRDLEGHGTPISARIRSLQPFGGALRPREAVRGPRCKAQEAGAPAHRPSLPRAPPAEVQHIEEVLQLPIALVEVLHAGGSGRRRCEGVADRPLVGRSRLVAEGASGKVPDALVWMQRAAARRRLERPPAADSKEASARWRAAQPHAARRRPPVPPTPARQWPGKAPAGPRRRLPPSNATEGRFRSPAGLAPATAHAHAGRGRIGPTSTEGHCGLESHRLPIAGSARASIQIDDCGSNLIERSSDGAMLPEFGPPRTTCKPDGRQSWMSWAVRAASERPTAREERGAALLHALQGDPKASTPHEALHHPRANHRQNSRVQRVHVRAPFDFERACTTQPFSCHRASHRRALASCMRPDGDQGAMGPEAGPRRFAPAALRVRRRRLGAGNRGRRLAPGARLRGADRQRGPTKSTARLFARSQFTSVGCSRVTVSGGAAAL